ncbi:hypothetical protein PM082_003668 [Marasmius tenuissimus]|nr:hypothetical protein PM082_003668 [Marasmius tenuissimus]
MALQSSCFLNELPHGSQSQSSHLDMDDYETFKFSFDPSRISEITKQMEIDIETLDISVQKHEEAALRARERSNRMKLALRSLKNTLSPTFRLPIEVLATVFERCVDCDTAGSIFSQDSMPWVLAKVCRRWRDVVLSTPSLWSTVRLYSRDTRVSQSNQLLMLQLWLERSQLLPLSCLAELRECTDITHGIAILDLLLAQSSRWINIDFDFGPHAALYHRMASLDLDMPLLTTLRIDGTFQHSADSLGVSSCWTAPILSEATLFILDSGDDDSAVTVYWPFHQPLSRLMELNWASPTNRSFLEISSRAFTNLRYCSLHLARHAGVDGLPRCTLQQLRHLDIYGPFRSVLSIMNRLTLPILEDLAFDFVEQISPVADHILSDLGRLRQRSSYSLHFLSCPLSILSPQSSSVHLDNNGSLCELRIIASREESYEKAVGNLSHSRLFPGLKILHVAFRESPDETSPLFSDVVSMIETRNSGRTSVPNSTLIKTVSIEMADYSHSLPRLVPIHHEAFLRLFGLQKSGLVLLGHVVDSMWHSSWRDTHWNPGEMDRAERRWHRFGRSDWLYRPEFEDFRS